VRSPLSAVFVRLADARSTIEELLTYEDATGEEVVEQLHLCRAAVQACLEAGQQRSRAEREGGDGQRVAELP
jgi:hypothetical protein